MSDPQVRNINTNKTFSFKNYEVDDILSNLKIFMDRKDKVGYIAARNYRIISEECKEFFDRRTKFLLEFGERGTNENGESIVSITPTSPNFEEFSEHLKDISYVQHTVNIIACRFSSIIGILSGEDIMPIEWMFIDDLR